MVDRSTCLPNIAGVKRFDSWTAFVVVLFAVVGICGLFASYATSIPLERGLARSALLDQVLVDNEAPDRTTRLQALRPALDTLAPLVLDAPGPIDARIRQARAIVIDEQRREESSLGFRARLMLVVVTTIAALIAAGILALARQSTASS